METAVQIYPTDFIDAYFTYTYTDAKVRQTRAVFGDLANSGEDLGLVPQNRFTMGVHLGPVYGLNVWLHGIFVGRQPAQSAETTGGSLDPIEPYYVFNTKASYTFKQFEIFCEVTNLFDRLYYTRGIYTGGTFYEVPAPEREIIAGIRCAWG